MSRPEQLQVIIEIIEVSKCGEELFFTDSMKAAKDIMKFIDNEGYRMQSKVIQLETEVLKCIVI